ncbi:c-di-GMP-binding flagellar brake protein YcgR, contains PilZNR and PilZ domains [Fontimonas thermophila]|uniref:C-di-GMP-binding flagellar brake protein YcgR, contains PilZNR and PilZ domains n=1 Tax=Fontimonas thermophila TaxID=1076937 RepID=A0A1I2JLB0_9GAMM|nr:flagellar brake protein [Fontimonas thermophila]SFF55364.1 c-di-GMP-binding flagellar brake protein YcgR, contains PilZNR and PilZ domains [Fontimonas thermophila]
MNDAAPSANHAEDLHGVLLRNPARIVGLLHRLRLHRSLLSIRFEGRADWHTSMIVAVDAAHGRLHLDAPASTPMPMPPPGTRIAVRGRLDGGDLRFGCRYTGTILIEGIESLAAAIPEEVFVLERRTAFRLNLPPRLGLPPSAIGREHPTHPTRLLDVSVSGAGAIVTPMIDPQIGETLHMHVQLPGASVQTAAEVRSTRVREDGVRVGLRFGALRREDETRLAQAIHRLERQLIRAARRPC